MSEKDLEKENKALLAKLKEQESESNQKIDELTSKVENLVKIFNKSNSEEEEITESSERAVPKFIQARAYKNEPIIKTDTTVEEKLSPEGYAIRGNTFIDFETVTGKKEKLPFGSGMSNDYLNLPVSKFELTKQIVDGSDFSGACRIERNVVVSEGGVVPEIIYVDNKAKATGKMIRQVVKRDIRYYTILVDGVEYEISEDQIKS